MKVIKAEQLVCPFMSFQGDGVRLCITTKCMAWIPITSEKVTKKDKFTVTSDEVFVKYDSNNNMVYRKLIKDEGYCQRLSDD